jgi:hypothetical protein
VSTFRRPPSGSTAAGSSTKGLSTGTVAGFWTLDGVRCTADGTDERPATAHGPYGCVAASVIGGPRYERFTTDSTFVAPATGRLVFISNTATKPERDNSSGRVYLLVQAVSGDNRD